ncbi:MAG: UMP kinase, partial [Candidatus Magasanikbacteria bacterium]|nr:UMP kinase [Candidatus Magasanikbacteria bacterium]
IGIQFTLANAHLVRTLFTGYSHDKVINNPHEKVKTKMPIIVAGGEKPGASSDIDAVDLAKAYGATEMINLSNIEYVFDKDPNKFKNAKKIEDINWKDFRKNIVGYKWEPGKNVPFDPTASGRAEKYKMTVSILNGTNLAEVAKALQGKKFKGTKVHP